MPKRNAWHQQLLRQRYLIVQILDDEHGRGFVEECLPTVERRDGEAVLLRVVDQRPRSTVRSRVEMFAQLSANQRQSIKSIDARQWSINTDWSVEYRSLRTNEGNQPARWVDRLPLITVSHNILTAQKSRIPSVCGNNIAAGIAANTLVIILVVYWRYVLSKHDSECVVNTIDDQMNKVRRKQWRFAAKNERNFQWNRRISKFLSQIRRCAMSKSFSRTNMKRK